MQIPSSAAVHRGAGVQREHGKMRTLIWSVYGVDPSEVDLGGWNADRAYCIGSGSIQRKFQNFQGTDDPPTPIDFVKSLVPADLARYRQCVTECVREQVPDADKFTGWIMPDFELLQPDTHPKVEEFLRSVVAGVTIAAPRSKQTLFNCPWPIHPDAMQSKTTLQMEDKRISATCQWLKRSAHCEAATICNYFNAMDKDNPQFWKSRRERSTIFAQDEIQVISAVMPRLADFGAVYLDAYQACLSVDTAAYADHLMIWDAVWSPKQKTQWIAEFAAKWTTALRVLA